MNKINRMNEKNEKESMTITEIHQIQKEKTKRKLEMKKLREKSETPSKKGIRKKEKFNFRNLHNDYDDESYYE